jgi:hypothetical protein
VTTQDDPVLLWDEAIKDVDEKILTAEEKLKVAKQGYFALKVRVAELQAARRTFVEMKERKFKLKS